MLTRLNGIFAFAVWDDRDKKLFLARDRLGVKPLYFTRADGVFGFASELRSLLPLVGGASLDETALADYLTLLWVPDPRTAFRGIEKLPPGHYAWVDRDGIGDAAVLGSLVRAGGAPRAGVGRRGRRDGDGGVRRQMVSDVPLGAFLSGGVDSSAIVAAMSAAGDRVSTYTIGFAPEDLRHEIVPDDVVHARRVATLFDTDSTERILEPNVLDLLPKAVWHLEEPVADPAAISTYLICRAARERMPVMLSGTGGDEVFAGYPRYLAYRLSRLLDHLPAPCSGSPSAASRESRVRGGQGGCAARAETCGSSCAARDCPRSSGTSPSRATTRRGAPAAGHAGARRGSRRLRPARPPPRLSRRDRRPRRAQPAAVPRPQDVPPVPQPDVHGQDVHGGIGRGARAPARRRARRPGRPDSVIAQAARHEAQVRLQEEPGARAPARHRVAAKGGVRGARSLMAQRRPRSDDRGSPLRGDRRAARSRRPGRRSHD